jgi:hypothetical protein
MCTSRTLGQREPTAIRALLYVSFIFAYVCFLRGLGSYGWPIPRPRRRTNIWQDQPNSFIS